MTRTMAATAVTPYMPMLTDTTINGWVMTPPEMILLLLMSMRVTEAVSDPMTADTVSYARVENDDDEGVVRTSQ